MQTIASEKDMEYLNMIVPKDRAPPAAIVEELRHSDVGAPANKFKTRNDEPRISNILPVDSSIQGGHDDSNLLDMVKQISHKHEGEVESPINVVPGAKVFK